MVVLSISSCVLLGVTGGILFFRNGSFQPSQCVLNILMLPLGGAQGAWRTGYALNFIPKELRESCQNKSPQKSKSSPQSLGLVEHS